ncbi:DUF1513 domain-containing protein [Colwellia psychrerythraea]|uniref:Putative conserved protein UCP028101 n=1 Tax=Colwellia psychrerythraea TaxID=28229 RepID=A0A099KWI6_COLPS|nr:DUF1513 domain-containing protein [Colwellia psychrerythraea]KGJ94951.1 putative conserved protein UCP028101 [Colwellia psychrerythraea]
MISRRKFLLGLGAVGSVAAIGTISAGSSSSFVALFNGQKNWLVSCCSDNKGNYFAAAFDLSGQLISKVALPDRGHDVIAMKSKAGHALVFARRPGNFVLEIDFTRGEVVSHIEVSASQRFYGHGVLIADDNILLTTENDYQSGKGLIVLRDRKSQQIIEQYDSGGIGPHQLAVMPNLNEKQIVIANGGIQTHPEQSRKKLNLNSMRPNLAYMALDSGQIEGKFELENKQLSIRHLDVSSQGKVFAGLQYQGASTDEVPLALSHHGEEQLTLLKADINTWRSMNQYTASVCINSNSNTVMITCPKADLLTFWQLDSNEFIASHKLKDGAGATLIVDDFIASTGRGRVILQKDPLKPYQVTGDFNDLRWDNHMAAIQA